MRLTKVTITGADDSTDLAELARISAEYPFVEWGLLTSDARKGGPRYPMTTTMQVIMTTIGYSRVSLHMCGAQARRIFADQGPAPLPVRYQLNGFSEHVRDDGRLVPLGNWIRRCKTVGAEVILQLSSRQALTAAELLSEVHPNVSALYDESGGRGKESPLTELTARTALWSGLRLGYAGGIGPDNVKGACEALTQHPRNRETWIDMESRVRTDDRLDFDKVRSVLEQARPFIWAPPSYPVLFTRAECDAVLQAIAVAPDEDEGDGAMESVRDKIHSAILKAERKDADE